MFNKCLIYLCDCTWLNMLYILNQMLNKHKKIFEYFSFFFLESVFVLKNFRKSKKFSTLLFEDLLVSHASCETPIVSLLIMFRDSLASETSSHEKHLERFSKFLGFGHFRDYFASGSPVACLLREVCDLLVSGCPSREKDLDKIFKILYKGFWWLVLVTCSRVIWVTKIACFA